MAIIIWKAAKELEEIVRSTEPIDFECASVYEDVGVTIRMGTRNGQGFYETEMPEDWESEFNRNIYKNLEIFF